jgi:RNA polymerase sigma-70 factor, ECF subfamily
LAAPSAHDVTQLLVAWSNGDQTAFEKLTPLVYNELHRLATTYMHREQSGHVLQATALVNEAYLRLVDCSDLPWQNRSHFIGFAAQLMRRILVDFARSRRSAKRGGAAHTVELDEAMLAPAACDVDLIALDEALAHLAGIDQRKSQIVELRFFGGLSVDETADLLRLSPRTVAREWNLARAWLHRELSSVSETESTPN